MVSSVAVVVHSDAVSGNYPAIPLKNSQVLPGNISRVPEITRKTFPGNTEYSIFSCLIVCKKYLIVLDDWLLHSKKMA